MTSDRVIMTRAALRAAARGGVAVLRERRVRTRAVAGWQGRTSDGRTVEVRPATGRQAAPHGVDVLVITCAGERSGELWTRADTGTSTYEILARLDLGHDVADAHHEPDTAEQAALAAALRLVIDEVRAGSPDLRIAVRRALDPLVRGPETSVLSGLGLTHVATFPGEVAAPQAWAGEERWERHD